MLKPRLLLKLCWGMALSTYLVGLPIKAQNTQDQVAPIQPSVMTEIRRAPFSELFSVENIDGDRAYLVKDRDFLSSNPDLGVITLWGSIPSREIIQVIVRYCLPNPNLATEQASLTELIVADGENILLQLNNTIATTEANFRTPSSRQWVSRRQNDPFSDAFMNPYYFNFSLSDARTYSPQTDCSFGASRFDLREVQEAIAELPDQTLDLRLVFSNGVVENWRLGRQTVEQIRSLPTITTE